MGNLDPAKLPPCTAHEAYTPAGASSMGKTHVGVRCLGPNVWNVLVTAYPGKLRLRDHRQTPGVSQVVQPDDLLILEGDLGNLPASIVTDPARAVGKTLRNSLGAGQPLRSDQLLAPLVIRQGRRITPRFPGAGFAVSSEGKAVNNAARPGGADPHAFVPGRVVQQHRHRRRQCQAAGLKIFWNCPMSG